MITNRVQRSDTLLFATYATGHKRIQINWNNENCIW